MQGLPFGRPFCVGFPSRTNSPPRHYHSRFCIMFAHALFFHDPRNRVRSIGAPFPCRKPCRARQILAGGANARSAEWQAFLRWYPHGTNLLRGTVIATTLFVCTVLEIPATRGIEFAALTRRFRVGNLAGRGKFSLGVPKSRQQMLRVLKDSYIITCRAVNLADTARGSPREGAVAVGD